MITTSEFLSIWVIHRDGWRRDARKGRAKRQRHPEYDSCGRYQRGRRHGFLRAVPRRGRHSGQGDFGAIDR
jgi:hypothetical protein